MKKKCVTCKNVIPQERLDVLPNADRCVKCVSKNPPKLDTSFVDLSEASPINRNGFAPKD